jgi:multidrug efflux pump
MRVAYDSTKFIQSSIDEVRDTLLEAVLIVVVVIFLFLASLRSVIIPVVTIPLSLVGACILMLAMGSRSTCSRCWRWCLPSALW